MDALTPDIKGSDGNRVPCRAVVFDMDGVLVDSEVWWHEARVEFAAAHGKRWSDEDGLAMMGMNSRQWRALMKNGLDLEPSEDEIQREVVDRMLARYASFGPPALDGAVDAVERLSAKVCTGGGIVRSPGDHRDGSRRTRSPETSSLPLRRRTRSRSANPPRMSTCSQRGAWVSIRPSAGG